MKNKGPIRALIDMFFTLVVLAAVLLIIYLLVKAGVIPSGGNK